MASNGITYEIETEIKTEKAGNRIAMESIKNPILRGMYPDPSICEAEGKYYLITSTFTYAPGVPIFESEDLVNWTQIGHILVTPGQLELMDLEVSSGIFAATIRYHRGIFYMITTNAGRGGNFYVTATCPKGPWSEPVFLKEAAGIDPSLFFDDDDCYYVGQRFKHDAKYDGDCEIWVQKLDLQAGKLVEESHVLWDGAAKNVIWPEGPHLYKKDGYYYLCIAEGGTAHEHSVNIARSKEIYGPYESCKNNPLLTHKHLGRNYPLQYIGHADLIEKVDGNWFAVMLGTRMYEEKSSMGRETFIVPVVWEDDWPVFCEGEGKISVSKETMCGMGRKIMIRWSDPLPLSCVMLRSVLESSKRRVMEERLHLSLGTQKLESEKTPAYIGIRVEEHQFSLKVSMTFLPDEGEEAGLVYYYNAANFIKLIVLKRNNKIVLSVVKYEKSIVTCVFEEVEELYRGNSILEMQVEKHKMRCILNGIIVADALDISQLTTQGAGGFVGCTMGVYGYTDKAESTNEAVFDSLTVVYP